MYVYYWSTSSIVVGLQRKKCDCAAHTQSQTQDQLPTKLSATVHWMAPFLSGGGYSSEAISYILALADVIPGLTIEQHGDAISPEFFYGLPLKVC